MRKHCYKSLFVLLSSWFVSSSLTMAQETNSKLLDFRPREKYHTVKFYENRTATKKNCKEKSLSNLDVLHYDGSLKIDKINASIAGEMIITALIDMTISKKIDLNLEQLTVDSVTVKGEKVSFIHNRGLVTVSLSLFALQTDTVAIRIWYHGRPGNDGFGGFFFKDKAIYTVGEGLFSDPPSMTRYWLPCHDVPSDKATLDLTISVPTPLLAVSNGKLIDTEMDETGETITYHWRETHPIATYLIAVAIGNFTVFGEDYISITGDTIPLEFYVYPQDIDKARIDFARVPQMMSFFENRFGPYPFDRYSMVELPIRGAMEHQTMTSYTDRWITGDNRNDAIVAHELAHHWWGNSVTLSDWREIWLNEGFASYCEALYFEGLEGQTALKEAMQHFAEAYFSEDARFAFPVYDPENLWGATVYDKGAWVLHMLRWVVGDSTFWQTLRNYAEKFAYGNATINDFKTTAETASGQDLNWFFEQWIYNAGYPKFYLGWDWSQASGGNYITQISVNQVQRGSQVFTMPVELLLKSDSSTYSDTIWVQEESHTYNILSNERPAEFLFDPNSWVLKRANVTVFPLPSGFKVGEYALAQNYPNPFHPSGSMESTIIAFQIGYSYAPAQALLRIYDMRGGLVKTLLDKKLTPDFRAISWDGYDDQGHQAPNGVYVYILSAGGRTIAKRMVLVR